MNLNEKTYVDRVFYVYGGPRDLMATLFRQGDGPWECEYRFRYYVDTRMDNTSKDEKRFFNVVAQDSSIESRDKLRAVFSELTTDLVKVGFGDQMDEVVIAGGIDRFTEEMSKRPWCNMVRVAAPSEDGYDEH